MKLIDIGITKYYNEPIEQQRIFTLKQRYEDFVVKEIHDDGICDVSDIYSKSKIYKTIEFILSLCELNNIESDLIKNTRNSESKDFFSDDEVSLYNLNPSDSINIGHFYFPDKNDRERIHTAVRDHPLVSSTTDANKNVVLTYGSGSTKVYAFTLMKTNKDTTEACSIIAKALRVSHNDVKFAGNKDKRAVTFQRVSVKGCTFKDIVALAEEYKAVGDNLQIFSVKQAVRDIKLGELEGNRFIIRVKCLNAADNLLLRGLDFTRMKNGFINYYGQQRFGKNFNNHIVGGFILHKDYARAIDAIMRVYEGDSEVIKEAKEHFHKEEYEQSLKKFPFRYATEKTICIGRLKQHADKKIVHLFKNEVMKFYLHAYQSYKFNIAASNLEKEKDVYVDLEKENNRHLKGGKRRLIEEVTNLRVVYNEEYVEVEFDLSTSAYATMALREVIGEDVFF